MVRSASAASPASSNESASLSSHALPAIEPVVIGGGADGESVKFTPVVFLRFLSACDLNAVEVCHPLGMTTRTLYVPGETWRLVYVSVYAPVLLVSALGSLESSAPLP